MRHQNSIEFLKNDCLSTHTHTHLRLMHAYVRGCVYHACMCTHMHIIVSAYAKAYTLLI